MLRPSRVLAAAFTVLAVGLLGVPMASAHNGVGAAFKGHAGRYTVYAYDGYPLPDGQLEYRLVLLEKATGEPISGVSPVINAHPPNASTPIRSARVTVMANVVLYDLPNPYPGDWTVEVSLSGPLGRGQAVFAMHGQAPYVPPAVHVSSGGSGNVVVPVLVAVAVVVAAGGGWLLWRRRGGSV